MSFGQILAFVIFGCCISVAANSQPYPSRPIQVVVPFAPGGVADSVARIVGERLTRRLGQSVVVDNRSGGNGSIGTEYVANSSPDGHTLLFVSANFASLGLGPKLPYDPVKHFTPISLLATSPGVLVVNAASPIRSVKELLEYARSNPDKLMFGFSGGLGQLLYEQFRSQTGVRAPAVPYKGSAAMLPDLYRMENMFAIESGSLVIAGIKSGRLRPLAVTAPYIPLQYLGLSTFSQAGLPSFNNLYWYGLVSGGSIPSQIALRLNSEIQAVLSESETQQRFESLGVQAAGSSTSQFEGFMQGERSRWVWFARGQNQSGSTTTCGGNTCPTACNSQCDAKNCCTVMYPRPIGLMEHE